MTPLIRPKYVILVFLSALSLASIALLPKAEAVVPPPDGGYPNGNTAEGQNALLSLTTGMFNTAVGFVALPSNTEGGLNTAIGTGALFNNVGGQHNTATGGGALLSNISSLNTANGVFALLNNTEGFENTATGHQALLSNVTGESNIAEGSNALAGNTTGSFNTATGARALQFATASRNTAIGAGSLPNDTSGGSNTVLGINAGAGVITATDVICIGADVDGENESNTCYIGNIFGVTSVGIGVLVNSAGKLGTTTSSRRFKENIKPMDKASEALFSLKPVSFHYKKEIDPASISQFGLVAEDVEKVNPNLVVRDKEGKPYTVRYDQVNAMLLNEFLKEHLKNEKQQATIADLEAELATLTAAVKQQAAQIQKVTAILEMSKPARQLAENNQ